MAVRPSTAFEWVVDLGETGLEGTVEVQIDDGTGTLVYGPSTVGITELGDTGTYVAALTSPGTVGEYVLQASSDGSFDIGTVASEQLTVSSTVSAPGDPPTGDSYATVEELAVALNIRAALTAAQEARMENALLAATGEIDSETGLTVDDLTEGWQLALAEQVCIERAVEHWHARPVGFAIVGLDSEAPIRLVSDSWTRHANKLAPLKDGATGWGFA